MPQKPAYEDLVQKIQDLEKETKRLRQVEEKLKESRERFKVAAQIATNVIYEWDTDKDILTWYGDVDTLFGYESGGFPRKITEAVTLLHPEDHDQMQKKLLTALAQNTLFEDEYRIRKKSGDYIKILSRGVGIYDDNGHLSKWIGTNTDITSRKKSEEALKQSEEHYRKIADNMEDLICEADSNGIILYLSPSHKNLLGYELEDLLGKKIFDYIHPDDLEKVIISYQKAVETRSKGKAEYRYRCADGRYIWIETTGNHLFDDNGEISGSVFSTRDISDRKKYEESLQKTLETLQTTQAQLVQSEKMASLGALVAGVAHEINTPIGVGITASSYLEDTVIEYEQLLNSNEIDRNDFKKLIKKTIKASNIIHNNLKQAAEIISSFKQVAVDQSIESIRKFNLKEYIDEVLISLEPKYKRTKHTITVICPEEIVIVSIPGSFFQIITNLVINSLIHGFEGVEEGNIVIEIADQDGTLHFRYQDDGIGMDEKTAKQIFDPFFTTKRNQCGTGLGMHLVYNIVAQTLNGQIKCRSSKGNGAEFLITLPLKDHNLQSELLYNNFV